MTSPLAVPAPWELVARAYAIDTAPKFEPFAREALRLANPSSRSRIVDVACGPGTLAALAAADGHAVSAIDFSATMIDELRARIEREGLRGIDPVVGDGMSLPYEDASFDAGFSMFGLMFFPDRARGFRELARVLRPDVPAVVSSWLPLDRVPVLAAAMEITKDVLPPPPDAPPPAPFPLSTREACVAEMTDGGFRDVVAHEVTFSTPEATITEHWQQMERVNAVIVMRRKSLGERWTEASREILARLRARFGDEPLAMAMPAYLTRGVR